MVPNLKAGQVHETQTSRKVCWSIFSSTYSRTSTRHAVAALVDFQSSHPDDPKSQRREIFH